MSDARVLSSDDLVSHRLEVLRHELEMWHSCTAEWPVEPSGIVLDGALVSQRNEDDGHYRAFGARDDGVAKVNVNGSIANVTTFARTQEAATLLLTKLREEIPRAADADPDFVPVTFWSLSPMGPQSLRRVIDAPAWEQIERNYPHGEKLASLLHNWTPGVGGQLLLWHGDAGTGKTTALRALGRQWRDWAQLHYIVDPEKFFGESASYMMSVMMGGEDHVKPSASSDRPSWRVLILEDCAEMLAPDARRDVGQALSRLLNACDGLIGRGLRLLILITTNEPLEKVHPAISRPGRCAHRIEFERFSSEEAVNWLAHAHGADGELILPETLNQQGQLTLADLYALKDGYRQENGRMPIGFGAAA